MKSAAESSFGPAARRACRQKFLRFFPGGFADPNYLDWERNYKAAAHARWTNELGGGTLRELLFRGKYMQIAEIAVSIEARTNLLFSFEKMAIRDAVRSISGACTFSVGLYEFLNGKITFNEWCARLAKLPRKKTRVLSWPIATVFPFLAMPDKHIFLKPAVTREAARAYDFSFQYEPIPAMEVYQRFLVFAAKVNSDLEDLRPRDLIDIQSFIWILGSSEYDE